jgi:hypothetical protein
MLKQHSLSVELHGLMVVPSAPAVSHLLFADDSLLLFKADTESAGKVQSFWINIAWPRAKGLIEINHRKGCPNTVKEGVKAALDVHSETLSEKYLGMPSDVGRSKGNAFKYIKDRIWKMIQGWMERLLSAGGKDILIKSVAQAIPIFSMACFLLPKGLGDHINAMIHKFCWGSRAGERKTCWVSWRYMCKPKYMGGLGFRDVELFNLALLARQVWRLLQNLDSLSARVLRARYFPSKELLTADLGSAPSQVWRAIHAGVVTLKQGLVKRIGTREATDLWNDNWLPHDGMLRPLACLAVDPPVRV